MIKNIIKKTSYWLVTAILAMSFLSLFVFVCDPPSPVRTWNVEDIKDPNTVTVTDFQITPSTNRIDYVSTERSTSNLKFRLNGEKYNLIVIEFADKLADGIKPQLYHAYYENGNFTNSHVDGSFIDNRNTCYFIMPYIEEEASAMQIKVNGNFSIKQISVYDMSGDDVLLKWNFVAMGVLLGMLLLLLIVEKKYRYFGWIFAEVKREFEYFKELHNKNKRGLLILHAATVIVTAVLVGTLAALIMINHFSSLAVRITLIICIYAVLLQLADRLISERNAQPAKIFLVTTLLIGSMMCYTAPTSTHTTWDDETHLRQASTLVDPMSHSISLADWRLYNLKFTHTNFMKDPDGFVRQLVKNDAYDVDYKLPSINMYTAISYLPMASGIGLSTLLQADLAKTLVLARFPNLIFYAIMVYLAMKKLKSGAYIFAAVCMLPCAFHLACSLNYDFWLTGWFAYGIACLLSVYQDSERKFGVSDLVQILIAFFLACAPKSLYCILFLPLLFIKKDKFADFRYAKRFRIATVLVVVLILTILILPGLFSYNMYTDSRGGEDVDSMRQIKFILSHPWQYTKTLIKHLGKYCSLELFNQWSLMYSYLGSSGVWHGTLYSLTVMFCIFTDRRDGDCYDTKSMQTLRWIFYAACFILVVLISTSMYVGFSNVGATEINGCQFRYLFPLMLPCFFFLSPKGIKHNINPRLQCALIFGALTLNLLTGYAEAYLPTFF